MKIPFVDLQAQYGLLSKEINQAFKKICQSSIFVKGPALEIFEKNFANFIGAKFCLGVASGTDALHLSLVALGIGKGDEVILPVNTFIATAYAVMYTGATPVLIDIDPLTYNIDVNLIEKKITRKTKAIIPVHLYGQPSEMDKIIKLSKKYKLFILEDCAQAHGATYKKKNIGTFGDIAAFSFYPGKNLGAYGDGGAIVTNSSKLAQRIRLLREYGSATKYIHDSIGFNSRLDSVQAAILSIKLKHLVKWNKKRQKLAAYYSKIIAKKIPHITTPFINKFSTSVYHLYVIKTPQRKKLANFLLTKGIQTGIHYPIPLHLQKSLKEIGHKGGDFPIAEAAAHQILSLPMYPELTTYQQNYIIESMETFFKK